MKIGPQLNIDALEPAIRLDQLCTRKFRIIATKQAGTAAGEGFDYTIPANEIRQFHVGVHSEFPSIFSCKGRNADGLEVVIAKLRKR